MPRNKFALNLKNMYNFYTNIRSGISYYGRTYEEGKKIGLKDGFRALYCIIKYNVFKK